jgi:hypothetical protein
MKKIIVFDAREIAKQHVTISVQVKIKKLWLVRFGLFLIKTGCKISGAQYVNEFPMSLLQDGKEVEVK